jgi:thiol-disulfide isomerase/thioredoxin
LPTGRFTSGEKIMIHCVLLPVVFALLLATEADPPNPLPRNPPPPSAPKPIAAKPSAPKASSTKSIAAKPAEDKTELSIGDPAPKIETQEFVKGQPVKQFEKGKTYVVEFWATWCGPCRESIPHLTKLQKDNKQVTFIGVSIDEETKEVKPFVDEMGDKMDYRVAIDARDGDAGRMARSWLEASSRDGIPAAFIVNGDGRIAWIGHPGDIEGPLDDIVAGKWDLAAEAAEYKRSMAEERAFTKLKNELGLLLKKKDYAGAITLLDAASKTMELKDEPLLIQLGLLAGPGNDPARALPIAEKIYAKAVKEEDGGTLMMVAGALADSRGIFPGGSSAARTPAKVDPKLAALAVKAAEKGEELTHTGNAIDDAETLMIVAKAYRAAGKNDKAAAKLDDAAGLVTETIESATKTLSDIRDLKSAFGGGTDASEKPTKKPAKIGK